MDLPTGPDETPTRVFNPSKEDYVHAFDRKDFILPSRKIVVFPKYLADHLAKNLARKLALDDPRQIDFEVKLNEKLESIYVIL